MHMDDGVELIAGGVGRRDWLPYLACFFEIYHRNINPAMTTLQLTHFSGTDYSKIDWEQICTELSVSG